ncbi:hypothetical protein NDU88_000735 [Pleurodeles waltl]|uniref:Uncharacterized protein n=1 Tax=Pleurodeles waltl TaxID=8319 RepID=A0AAV7SAW5_PLEWA|nr:hypothetical protein NDU88_000735 [Pleurodeles waltl]
MPPSKASAAKRKGRDPELSQLLKMVLEKLGNGDADRSETASDNEVCGEIASRPRLSHVAPRAAFPPVKRRKNGKTASPAPTSQVSSGPPSQVSPAVVISPVQVAPRVTPVPEVATPPAQQGPSVGAPIAPALGVEEVLANIRNSLASLSPAGWSGPPSASLPGVASPVAPPLPPPRPPLPPPTPQAPEQQAQVHDSSRQALLEVSRLLASISSPASTPLPTTPWVANDSLQNSLLELKRQVDALSAVHPSSSSQAPSNSPCVAPTLCTVVTAPPVLSNVLPSTSNNPVLANSAKEGSTDALLSRPGKLAAHVSTEVKENIWKGEFVDVFSLIRARRREVDYKDKEAKPSSYGDRKPKVEENITNRLFGFNVFMSVLLEKKPELGTALIYYTNKILKAQHTYGGTAWLEYDRDFRWAKVEDPSIGWDQTEVNVWL